MANEQVEQSSDGTQLNNVEVGTNETASTTFPSGQVEDPQFEAEQRAFKTYVENTGQPIPENFKSVESWFSSLKEAQANYTRGQQEIAELKQQYAAEGSAPPPEEAPPVEAAPAPTEAPITQDSPELRIQKQVKEEQVASEAEAVGVTQETYEAWAMEMASTGEISEETRNEIRTKTGFTEKMIDDYVSGQKARLRENFAQASSVVGGQQRLQQIFDWASQSLTAEELQTINIGLASPSYEVTLRGLSSMYEQATISQKAAEPAQNQQLTSVPASETGVVPYSTQREFKAERNDPRFNIEPSFRQKVEARMSMTDWNSLPF
tara:strand:+ start:76 stop:1038 length:963 start_codon:yes stop_codon:yes gene_type:complete